MIAALIAVLCGSLSCSKARPPLAARHLVLVTIDTLRMAPLGHYVLADVYERQGRAADARRQVAAANRLKRGG